MMYVDLEKMRKNVEDAKEFEIRMEEELEELEKDFDFDFLEDIDF